MLILRWALLASVLLCQACWASGVASSAADSRPACGPKLKPGMHQASMQFGLLERSYQVYVPRAWDNKSKRPMVLGLHGGYGTGKIFDEQTQASRLAEQHNMLLLLPDGHYKSWNAGDCCKPATKLGVRDVGFLTQLVKQVSQQYCVDESRIFATGFSNGAMMTHRLACEKPGLLKAIAPVSGGIMSECKAAKGVAALLIQGRDDPRIFWDGGTFDGSYRPSMAEVVANLAKRNACDASQPGKKSSIGPVICHSLNACGKQPLQYCGVQGVGHQWPGGKSYWTKKLGPNTQAFKATDKIFEFFSQF